MKKIITLMFAAALAAGAYADEFVSPGNGTVYTSKISPRLRLAVFIRLTALGCSTPHSPSPTATCFVCKTTKW